MGLMCPVQCTFCPKSTKCRQCSSVLRPHCDRFRLSLSWSASLTKLPYVALLTSIRLTLPCTLDPTRSTCERECRANALLYNTLPYCKGLLRLGFMTDSGSRVFCGNKWIYSGVLMALGGQLSACGEAIARATTSASCSLPSHSTQSVRLPSPFLRQNENLGAAESCSLFITQRLWDRDCCPHCYR